MGEKGTTRQAQDVDAHEDATVNLARRRDEPAGEREREIAARLAAATPGPWTQGARGPMSKDELMAYLINCVECSPLGTLHLVWKPDAEVDICQTGNGMGSEANAEFIAHAPDDIAYLLAALTDRRAASGGTDEQNTAWLVERVIDGRPHWMRWRNRDRCEWVTDATLADRFSASEVYRQARLIAKSQGVECVATEHMFVPRPTSGAGERATRTWDWGPSALLHVHVHGSCVCSFGGQVDERCADLRAYLDARPICPRCGHLVGWHRFGRGACLECACLHV